jgi:hypothetical protein
MIPNVQDVAFFAIIEALFACWIVICSPFPANGREL